MRKIIIGIFIVLIAVVGFSGIGLIKDKSHASEGKVITDLDLIELSKDHIKLDVPETEPKVDSEAAKKKAKEAFAGFTVDAKEVKAEYHLITNEVFRAFSQQALNKNLNLKAKKHMDKLPAYIISFKGVTFYGHSVYGGQRPVHHEFNVIVDAISGEALMAFSYA